MRDLEEIKTGLREIQSNFNPAKETYKIIDEVVNGSLKPEEILKKLSEIKGTNKYPDSIKNKYISIIEELQKIVIDSKKKEEKKRQEENSRELKDIIEKLEKTKKNEKKIDDEKEDESKNIDSQNIANNDKNIEDKRIDDNNKDKIKKIVSKPLPLSEDLKEKCPGKKLFSFLLIMVILSVIIGITIFLFL